MKLNIHQAKSLSIIQKVVFIDIHVCFEYHKVPETPCLVIFLLQFAVQFSQFFMKGWLSFFMLSLWAAKFYIGEELTGHKA